MRARTIWAILVLLFGVSALFFMYTSQFTIPGDKIEEQVKTLLVEDKITDLTYGGLLKDITSENQIEIVECKEEYPFLFCSGYITARNQRARFFMLFQKSVFSDTYQYRRGHASTSGAAHFDSEAFLFKGVSFSMPHESVEIKTGLFLNGNAFIVVGIVLLLILLRYARRKDHKDNLECTSVSVNDQEPLLILTRPIQSYCKYCPFRICVDKCDVGAIYSGDEQKINVSAGTHSLYLKWSWFHSESYTFEIQQGQEVRFTCGTRLNWPDEIFVLFYYPVRHDVVVLERAQ